MSTKNNMAWRSPWQGGEGTTPAHCAVPPPPHPTYDLEQVIRDALAEDGGERGDVTTVSTVASTTMATATFLAKANGILAGLAVADLVFRLVDPSLCVSWSAADGDAVRVGQQFGTLEGSARSILLAERIALNFLQRMSGVATATAAMVEAVQGHRAKILDTRKTVPGLRLLDKWAVLIGGGMNHRIGLFDMLMIKDNHIAAAGGIEKAVSQAQEYLDSHSLALPVEVETRTLNEVSELLRLLSEGRAGCVTRVMLDNMVKKDSQQEGGVDVSLLQQAVSMIGDKMEMEASGNVTIHSVAAIAATGVHYISCGALTHSVTALDISLNITTQ